MKDEERLQAIGHDKGASWSSTYLYSGRVNVSVDEGKSRSCITSEHSSSLARQTGIIT
jgi:hypothetical protein